MTVQVAASGHPKSNTRVTLLILYVSVDLSRLLSGGKDHRWPRPRRCPSCAGGRIWSHGYVERYFDALPCSVPVKRWRCVDCRAVHTMRPSTHWRGFLASRKTICRSLNQRVDLRGPIRQASRQRQQYWFVGLLIQHARESVGLPLSALLKRPILLASHSLSYREIHPCDYRLHRIFAFTPPSGWP